MYYRNVMESFGSATCLTTRRHFLRRVSEWKENVRDIDRAIEGIDKARHSDAEGHFVREANCHSTLHPGVIVGVWRCGQTIRRFGLDGV